MSAPPDPAAQLLKQLDLDLEVSDLLPERAVDLYLRLRGLGEKDMAAFLGFLAAAFPQVAEEALLITGGAP